MALSIINLYVFLARVNSKAAAVRVVWQDIIVFFRRFRSGVLR